MNELFFSEKLYDLQKEVRDFLLKKLEPIKNEINQGKKTPVSFIREMGKNGLIGPLIPKKYNGTELGMIAHCMITDEISRINVSASVPRTPCILDSYLLNIHGNEEQKENYLKKIATGEKICGICVTEETAGSNVAGIK